MKKGQKGPRVDRAVPTIRQPKRRDSEKVAITRSLQQTAPASPDWAQATDLQHAVTGLGTVADHIEAQAKVLSGLRDQLSAAEALMATYRRDWDLALTHLTGVVGLFSKGSVDVVKGFGFEVKGYVIQGALAAPANLVLVKGKDAGDVLVRWSKTGHLGYVVQHATDPANPATYSVPTPCTRTRYTITNLPPSSNVFVRVAAVDPASSTGMSPWTTWDSAVVR